MRTRRFRDVMEGMNISFDGFIRTTDAAHVNQVRNSWSC